MCESMDLLRECGDSANCEHIAMKWYQKQAQQKRKKNPNKRCFLEVGLSTVRSLKDTRKLR